MSGSDSNSNWNKLFKRLDGTPEEDSPEGRMAARKAKLAAEARRVLDEWCETAANGVVAALRVQLNDRAKELAKATGRKVFVRTPDKGLPLLGKYTMPSSFTTITLGDAYVHLYVTRSPGRLPVLHYAVDADALLPPPSGRGGMPKGAASHRVVSTPTCSIGRGPDGRPRLLAPGGEEDGPTVKLDDIVYRVFEQLIDTFEALG